MNYWAILPYTDIKISGDDAISFLQGQVTADINKITEHNTCHAAYCDPKGRMLANILLYKKEDYIHLRLNNDILDATLKRLKMFVLRSKVVFTSTDNIIIGASSKQAALIANYYNCDIPTQLYESKQNNDICIIKLAETETSNTSHSIESHYEIIINSANSTRTDISNLLPIDEDLSDCNSLRILAGFFNIHPETIGKFLPQNTSLANTNAISYDKGCYVGQEIIARHKYLGKVKKTLATTILNQASNIDDFTEVINNSEQITGHIIESVILNEKTYCSAIISIDSLQQPVTISNKENVSALFSTVI